MKYLSTLPASKWNTVGDGILYILGRTTNLWWESWYVWHQRHSLKVLASLGPWGFFPMVAEHCQKEGLHRVQMALPQLSQQRALLLWHSWQHCHVTSWLHLKQLHPQWCQKLQSYPLVLLPSFGFQEQGSHPYLWCLWPSTWPPLPAWNTLPLQHLACSRQPLAPSWHWLLWSQDQAACIRA